MIETLNKYPNIIGPKEVCVFFEFVSSLTKTDDMSFSRRDLTLLEQEQMYLIYRPNTFRGEEISWENFSRIYSTIVDEINMPFNTQINYLKKERDEALDSNLGDTNLVVTELTKKISIFENNIIENNFSQFGSLFFDKIKAEKIVNGWYLVSARPIAETANLNFADQTAILYDNLYSLSQKFDCLDSLRKSLADNSWQNTEFANNYRPSFLEISLDILLIYLIKNTKYLKDKFSWTRTQVFDDPINNTNESYVLVGGGHELTNSLICYVNDLAIHRHPDLMTTLSVKI